MLAAGVDILTGERKSWSFEKKLDALWRIDVQAGIRIARNIAEKIQNADQKGSILMIGWDAIEWGMAGDSAELFAAAKANARWRYNNYRRLAQQQWGVDPEVETLENK